MTGIGAFVVVFVVGGRPPFAPHRREGATFWFSKVEAGGVGTLFSALCREGVRRDGAAGARKERLCWIPSRAVEEVTACGAMVQGIRRTADGALARLGEGDRSLGRTGGRAGICALEVASCVDVSVIAWKTVELGHFG